MNATRNDFLCDALNFALRHRHFFKRTIEDVRREVFAHENHDSLETIARIGNLDATIRDACRRLRTMQLDDVGRRESPTQCPKCSEDCPCVACDEVDNGVGIQTGNHVYECFEHGEFGFSFSKPGEAIFRDDPEVESWRSLGKGVALRAAMTSEERDALEARWRLGASTICMSCLTDASQSDDAGRNVRNVYRCHRMRTNGGWCANYGMLCSTCFRSSRACVDCKREQAEREKESPGSYLALQDRPAGVPASGALGSIRRSGS